MKSQIWIAVSVYVIVAIIRKRLNIDESLHTILQILSLTIFEKTPLNELLDMTAQQVSVRRRRDVVVCCLLIEDSFPVFSERAEPDVFPGLCEFILSVVFAPPLCCSDMDPSGRLVGDP